MDGHRWVAAEPRRNGFDLWGYQDDTPEIVYLGSGAHEEAVLQLWRPDLISGLLRCSDVPCPIDFRPVQVATI
jgi:hypothetical protein